MKFGHIADCHLGSWRDDTLMKINLEYFHTAIDMCLAENIDFLLVAGDLFNTAVPSINIVVEVTKRFRELHEKNITIYIIPGSHDYSPAGKTIINILETAGFCINVAHGSADDDGNLLLNIQEHESGGSISGMVGKKAMLEKKFYESLNLDLFKDAKGFPIFLFHSAITEYKPVQLKDSLSVDLSYFPKIAGYFAGGHVHYRFIKEEPGYGVFVYPGPIFPNSFSELEDLGTGSFCIVTVSDNLGIEKQGFEESDNHSFFIINGKSIHIERKIIDLYPVRSYTFDCSGQDAHDVIHYVKSLLQRDFTTLNYFKNGLVTLRFKGKLTHGKLSDIAFIDLFNLFYESGALLVLKNTVKLQTEGFEEIKISDSDDPDVLLDSLITEHVSQVELQNVSGVAISDELKTILSKKLFHAFDTEKQPGERVVDFDKRLSQDAHSIFNIENPLVYDDTESKKEDTNNNLNQEKE